MFDCPSKFVLPSQLSKTCPVFFIFSIFYMHPHLQITHSVNLPIFKFCGKNILVKSHAVTSLSNILSIILKMSILSQNRSHFSYPERVQSSWLFNCRMLSKKYNESGTPVFTSHECESFFFSFFSFDFSLFLKSCCCSVSFIYSSGKRGE